MDQQFRQAIEQLGPNPDPQQAAAIAMRFGKPDLAVQFANQVEARKSREAIAGQTDLRTREMAAEREATRRELAGESGLLRRELAGQTDITRRDLAAQADATRRELAANNEALRLQLAGGKKQEREEQKGATADYATLLTDRLNTLLADNPRSATGIFAPVVRATEAVVNSLAPGAIGSQATITSQTKEQLITVLSQLRGGGQGRLSNQDMRRIDTAIGQINSGTQEGMAQGLSDTYDLIDTLQGKPARSGKGVTRPIGSPVPAPPPGFTVDR